jgi:hypothetical protein
MDIPFNPHALFDDAGRVVDQRQKERKPMKPEERRKAIVSQLISTTFSLRPSDDIFCLVPDHYAAYCALLINLAAGVDDQDGEPIDPLSPEYAREMLLQGRRPDEKRIANKRRKAEAENKPFKAPERRPLLYDITAAASGIGEINIKLSDPKIDRTNGLTIVPNIPSGMMNVLKSSALTSSGNISASVRRGYAGNSAHTVGAKILSARHKDAKGEIVTLYDLLIVSDEARQVLVSLGLPPENLGTLIEARNSGTDLSGVTAVHPGRMKVMFVPIGPGKYVQVTPVSSTARFVEQNSRLRKLGRRVKSSRTRISDKPQNAGMYPLFENGQIIRLHADFPRQGAQERRAYAIAAGRPPIDARAIPAEAAEAIITLSVTQGGRTTVHGADQAGYTNIRIRAALEHWITSAASGCLDALLESVGNLETLAPDKRGDVSKAKSYVRHLLDPECGIAVKRVRADFVRDAKKTVRDAVIGAGRRKGREADAAQAIGFTASSFEKALNQLAIAAFK